MVILFQIHDLPYYITALGYLGIFIFFLTVDQITPIPEEVSLLTIGYFSSKGVFNPFVAALIALTAFLTVDSTYFFLVKGGKKLSGGLQKKMEGSFLKIIKEKFTKNFPKALFVICFIPRMRLWAPLASSALQIPYRRFIKFDALSLAVFTALYIALGIFFHKGLDALIAKLKMAQNLIFFGAMLFASIVVFILIRKYRRSHNH